MMTIPKGSEAKSHVYEHEHVHVSGSTMRLLIGFAPIPKDTHLHKSVTNYTPNIYLDERRYQYGERRPFRTKELPIFLYHHRRASSDVAVA